MDKIVNSFIEETNHITRLRDVINDKIRLQKALRQKRFLTALLRPCFPCDDYGLGICPPEDYYSVIASKIITELLSEFEQLPARLFIFLFSCVTKKTWAGLPQETRERTLKRLQRAVRTQSTSRNSRFTIFLSSNSFLASVESDVATQILMKFRGWCQLYIDSEFLPLLQSLPLKTFQEILDNAILYFHSDDFYYHSNQFPDCQRFDALPRQYRQVLLQALINKKVKDFSSILYSKNISKKFLDIHASQLVEEIGADYVYEYLCRRFNIDGRQSSKFILTAAQVVDSGLSRFLSKDDLEEYARGLSPTLKTAWAELLQNKNIVFWPALLTRAVKCYGSLSSPPESLSITIPDEILHKLSPLQAAGLVANAIDSEGRLTHLKFNPQVLVQRLTSIALTNPTWYQQAVAEKISLAIERFQVGI